MLIAGSDLHKVKTKVAMYINKNGSNKWAFINIIIYHTHFATVVFLDNCVLDAGTNALPQGCSGAVELRLSFIQIMAYPKRPHLVLNQYQSSGERIGRSEDILLDIYWGCALSTIK